MAKRKKKNKHYSRFKRDAIRLLATRGDSTVEEIASSLGWRVSEHVVPAAEVMGIGTVARSWRKL